MMRSNYDDFFAAIDSVGLDAGLLRTMVRGTADEAASLPDGSTVPSYRAFLAELQAAFDQFQADNADWIASVEEIIAAYRELDDIPALGRPVAAGDELLVRSAGDGAHYRVTRDDVLLSARIPTIRREDLPTDVDAGQRAWVPDCPRPSTSAESGRGASCIFTGKRWVRDSDYADIYASMGDLLGDRYGLYTRTGAGLLYQSDNRERPVTASGQTVGLIADDSGNSLGFAQSSTSRQGVWDGSGLQIDGVDDAYAAGASFRVGDGVSLYAAFAYENPVGNDPYRSCFTTDLSPSGSFHLGIRGDGAVSARMAGPNGQSTVDVTQTGAAEAGQHVLEQYLTMDGALHLYLDGRLLGSDTSTNTFPSGHVSDPLSVYLFDGTSMSFRGFVMIQGTVSPADRVDIRRYLVNPS